MNFDSWITNTECKLAWLTWACSQSAGGMWTESDRSRSYQLFLFRSNRFGTAHVVRITTSLNLKAHFYSLSYPPSRPLPLLSLRFVSITRRDILFDPEGSVLLRIDIFCRKLSVQAFAWFCGLKTVLIEAQNETDDCVVLSNVKKIILWTYIFCDICSGTWVSEAKVRKNLPFSSLVVSPRVPSSWAVTKNTIVKFK